MTSPSIAGGAGAARSDVNLTAIKIISDGIRHVDEAYSRPTGRWVPPLD
jgi:hypothetical protein